MGVQKVINANTVNQGHLVATADKLGNYESISVDVAPTGLGVNDYAVLNYNMQNPENSIQHADISVSTTDSGVISGIDGQSIEVVSYVFLCSEASTVTFLSDTTPLSSGMSFDQNGGVSHGTASPTLKTNPGEALNITSSSGNVNGHISYRVS